MITKVTNKAELKIYAQLKLYVHTHTHTHTSKRIRLMTVLSKNVDIL